MKEIKTIQSSLKNKQPSNLEAEQALLGSILVNNDIIDEISTLVNSNIFYDPAHIKIYEVIENLNNNKTQIKKEIAYTKLDLKYSILKPPEA